MPSPIVFLAGPHGSGKSVLGARACAHLGLSFLDLSTLPLAEQRAQLNAAVAERTADVIALSVELQEPAATFKLARRAGVLVGLWAHPLEMQARSGRTEPLFTPARDLTTQGGFGREGTRCPEFRRLDRGCHGVLLLRDLSLDEATEELIENLREIRDDADEPGLAAWVKAWRDDHGADPKAAKILADAMVRYFAELEAKGTSPRTLSGIESDLEAAGMLVFGYEAPKGRGVLDSFEFVPCEIEYRRKFSDSPNAIARYRRSLEGFARFLDKPGSPGASAQIEDAPPPKPRADIGGVLVTVKSVEGGDRDQMAAALARLALAHLRAAGSVGPR